MNREQLKKLERDLWAAADKLRANSDLKASEYSTPVLGLIFLKFADNKYRQHEAAIQAEYEKLKDTRMERSLKDIAAKVPAIGDVRGLGAMVAIELCKNGDAHQPDADLTKRVCAEAIKRGLVMLSCGTYGNVLRILVPLTVPDAQLAEGLGLLAEAFDAATAA
mgnify:CR=1 FL=1